MHHTGPHRTSLHYKLVSKSELTMCFRHFSNKLLQKLSKTFLKFFKKSSKILKNFLKMSKALSLQKIGQTDRQTDRQTDTYLSYKIFEASSLSTDPKNPWAT